ncbi:MAG: hypothetical protein ACRBN8_21050 [Nannocystales bacterium]
MRVNVVGSSGSGKSTLAAAIARRTGVPRLELDAIHHLPRWQPRPLEDFRDEISRFVAGDAWVIDGNYTKARDVIWKRADTVVFLDLPRPTVMRQLILRSLSRAIRRTELWNGNRESLRALFSPNPENNVVLWSWNRYSVNRTRFDDARADLAWSHIDFVRLRSHARATEWLEGCGVGEHSAGTPHPQVR